MLRTLPPILLAFALQQGQGVEKARSPDPPTSLPPVQEPFRTPVERRDLLQEFTPRSPLEGFYELRRIVRPGRLDVTGAKGYLAIGRTHLSLHLEQPAFAGEPGVVQSGFRSYTLTGNELVTTALLGHTGNAQGLTLDPPGLVETRTWQLIGSLLRIQRSDTAFMEFARIE